mgnify:CR=1 FL=1
MPKRITQFTKDGVYHVYNHAVHDSKMMICPEDYFRIVSLFQYYSLRLEIDIPVWCCMPNHFHLLVLQRGDVPVSRLLFSVCNAYTKSYNHQYARRGALFEGRFKDKPVANQTYLEQLCLYIHSNPVQAGLCEQPEDWPWSNLDECLYSERRNPVFEGIFRNGDEYMKALREYCHSKTLRDDNAA